MQRITIFAAALTLLATQVSGHGRLTMPPPRSGDVEDPDSPINFNGDDEPESNRFPANDPSNHPEGQSFVCRVSNSEKSSPITITAGGSVDLKWQFTAEHPVSSYPRATAITAYLSLTPSHSLTLTLSLALSLALSHNSVLYDTPPNHIASLLTSHRAMEASSSLMTRTTPTLRQ
jgi:hypothetical protein